MDSKSLEAEKNHWKLNSKIKYDYETFFKEQQRNQVINLFLKYGKKGALLEAGCGWGYYVKAFSALNKKVVGLDFEESMIKSSKTICKGIKNIKLVKGDTRELPFKDGTFDTVTSYGVVEHFDETEKAISELSRVLKKEGTLFISIPSAYNLTTRLLRRIAMIRGKLPYYYQKHYTVGSFKSYLTKANLDVIHISGYVGGIGVLSFRNKVLNAIFKVTNNLLLKNLYNLQQKESKLTPFFSHMIIFVCKKKP